MWYAVADYEDGTHIEKYFDAIDASDEEQYQIECWLIERHENCTYYSVVYVNEND